VADVSEQQSAVALPAPRLRPFVAEYAGYRFEGFEPGVHAGLPSRHLTLIVSFDAPVDVAVMPDPTQRPERFFALVGGLNAGPVMIRHDGNQHGVHVHITALGARALFGRPAGDLATQVLRMEDVIGNRAHELVDRLHTANHWVDRFAIFDDVLTQAIVDAPPMREEVAFAWSRLTASGGAVTVGALADDVGWSRRHLTEKFRAEFGLPPKQMAKVLRFGRARDLLVAPDRPSLARVAAECGYADQAHLARDWRDLAGSSPSAWLETEVFPIVQDEATLEAAG
jgi:AraC-like DNA-binding protein